MFPEKLLQKRLNEFQPEPLVTLPKNNKIPFHTLAIKNDTEEIDLAKTNFLNILDNQEIKNEAEKCIRKYGVGTCGPRGFYGTTEVHTQCEEKLARFLNTEESILYSYGFVTLSSVIPAYCSKNDIIFVDKEANFPITQGLKAARSKIILFEHNNPESLYEKLQNLDEKEKTSKKVLLLEGISWKTGKLCPLPEFVKIAQEFTLRIFLEETYSIGVLGKTGRGLTEYFCISPEHIDIIFGTLEGATGSIGGFCAGSSIIIEHQRLNGSGYTFSASLPTYLAQVAITSIDLFENKPQKFVEYVQEFDKYLRDVCRFYVSSDPKSPFKIFTCKNPRNEKDDKRLLLYCRKNGIHFLKVEKGLQINLNLELLEDKLRMKKVYEVIQNASHVVKNI